LARKILLADDSVTAQNMGRKILADAGYEVITVNNGSAALKKITEAHPDLIVLDVYMPGYSGLEVCQRIKENSDTSRIPVLLTVGKLEPFKQEEARRARADAFIIKPFEATELLAAVGKLQDKLGVVASPSSSKDTRFATATMNSFEKAMEQGGPKFGDQDSGWKSRLTIPAGAPKLTDTDCEIVPEPSASAFRDIAEENFAPAANVGSANVERPIPAGIPQDITPDEIAALTAAAARVNIGMSVGKDFERFKHDASRQALSPDTNQVDSTAKAPEENTTSSGKAVDSDQPEKAAAAASAKTPQDQPAETTSKVTPAVEPNTTQVQPAAVERVPEKIEQPVAVASAEVATIAVGSRWVAEEVPVEADESMLVLEREMHKAFAAFAAAEYAALPPDERGAVDKDDEPMFASMAPPAIGSPVPIAEETASDSNERIVPEENRTVGSRIDQPSAPLVAKPPVAPFASAAAMKVDEEDHAVAAFGGPDPFGKPEQEKTSPPETAAEVAAIAASVASKTDSAEKASSSEIAAAGWKDIREDAKAGRSLEDLKTAASGEPKELIREAAMAAAASADGSAPDLSSIVDNMLAELKPKLMAELAKKLDQKK